MNIKTREGDEWGGERGGGGHRRGRLDFWGIADVLSFKSISYNLEVVAYTNLPHTRIHSALRVYSGVPIGFLCVFRRV